MRIPGRKILLYGSRLVRSKFVNHGLILGYHRVNNLSWDPFKLSVSPEHFAQQLEILCEYANVLPLHDLAIARANGHIPPRSVAITFDDGYADYLSEAQPLLGKAALPSTIFISTGYLGQEFWWDTLTCLVGLLNPADALALDADGAQFEWRPDIETRTLDRTTLLSELSKFLLPLSSSGRSDCLRQLANSSEPIATETRCNLALTESELVQLASDDLVTIGCHTVSHPMLALLPADQQKAEIMQSKQALEAMTGQAVNGFSFPNGSKSTLSIRLVQECGFTHACASHNDVVWRNSNPFDLPRLWVSDCAGDAFLNWLKPWL